MDTIISCKCLIEAVESFCPKPRVRGRVEHPFGTLKRRFGFTKVRYRSLTKNANHLSVACALLNLMTASKRLLKQKKYSQAKYAMKDGYQSGLTGSIAKKTAGGVSDTPRQVWTW